MTHILRYETTGSIHPGVIGGSKPKVATPKGTDGFTKSLDHELKMNSLALRHLMNFTLRLNTTIWLKLLRQ